jgi:hypothetical protein
MNIEDWRTVSVADIDPAMQDLDTSLLPLLRAEVVEALGQPSATWGERMANECRAALVAVLPLRENEMHFLNRLLADGELEPEHLTSDEALTSRIRRHPALLWKKLNVRKHFRLDG